MNSIILIIGQRIRSYRINQHLSQEKLAELCNLHPTYIGQLERGEKNATIETIAKVADALKIDLGTLFEKIDVSKIQTNSYPLTAYNIIQRFSEDEQKKLIDILNSAVEFKNINNY